MTHRTRLATSTTISPRQSTCLAETAAGPSSLQSSYRLLLRRGLSATEAGNVVAYMSGLRPAESGWSVDQIKRLVAFRALVTCGVVAP